MAHFLTTKVLFPTNLLILLRLRPGRVPHRGLLRQFLGLLPKDFGLQGRPEEDDR